MAEALNDLSGHMHCGQMEARAVRQWNLSPGSPRPKVAGFLHQRQSELRAGIGVPQLSPGLMSGALANVDGCASTVAPTVTASRAVASIEPSSTTTMLG